MTLQSTIGRNDYTAAALQTNFTITFPFLEVSDINVFVNGVELTTGFTITPANVGGTLTFATGRTLGDRVAIVRDVPLTQELDLERNTRFPAEEVERTFDRVVMQQIDQQGQIDKTIKLSDASPLEGLVLDDPTVERVGHGVILRQDEMNEFFIGYSDENFDEVVETIQQDVEAAQTSATASATSATASATSATNSATSATASATSATNAADSATEAARSVVNAESFKEALLDIKPSIKSTPNDGWGWCWGGEYSRAAYPEAWTEIQLQGSRFITEAAWQTESANAGASGAVPYFSDGDGSTTFRVMRLTDFHRGSLTVTASDRVLDTIKSHNSEALSVTFSGASTAAANMSLDNVGCDGIIGGTSALAGHYVANSGQDSLPFVRYVGGSETAPKHWFAPWQIKLAGSVVNDGTLDASALQTQINTINGTTIPTAVAPLLGTDDYVKIVDEKTSGTAAGGFTSGAWRVRTLNTVKTNTITNASLAVATSQISLPAGKYFVRFSAPAYQVNSHKCRLYNVTDSSVTIDGDSAFTSVSHAVVTRTEGFGDFTITGTKAFRIEHQSQNTKATNGLGVDSSFGDVEVYTTIEIWKVG